MIEESIRFLFVISFGMLRPIILGLFLLQRIKVMKNTFIFIVLLFVPLFTCTMDKSEAWLDIPEGNFRARLVGIMQNHPKNSSMTIIDEPEDQIETSAIPRLARKKISSVGSYSAAYTPNGKYILNSIGGKILLLDSVNLETIKEFPGDAFHLIVNPEGTQYCTTGMSKLAYSDLETGKVISQLDSQSYFTLQYSNDGKLLLAVSNNGVCNLFDLTSNQKINSLNAEKVCDARFNPSSTDDIAVCASKQVALWDLRNNKELHKGNTTAPVYNLVYSHDGKRIVSAGLNQFIISDGKTAQAIQYRTLHGVKETQPVHFTKSSPLPVDVKMMPDSNSVVLSNLEDETNGIVCFDIEQDQSLFFLPHAASTTVTAFDINPQNKTMFSGGFQSSNVCTWDISKFVTQSNSRSGNSYRCSVV